MENEVTRKFERRARAGTLAMAMLATSVFGAALVWSAGDFGFSAPAAKASPLAPDGLSAEFSLCGDGRRMNCVVDGDTFWFHRQKIRIADIDAPELSPPRCEAERAKGEAAKRHLLALLNAGKFSLTSGDRDEDKYGRKLRQVTRDGRSFGDILVSEGLARRWDGTRQPWCG